MKQVFIILAGALIGLTAYADSPCPDLHGTYRCDGAWILKVEQTQVAGTSQYRFTFYSSMGEPAFDDVTYLADGKEHPFSDSGLLTRASFCDETTLVVRESIPTVVGITQTRNYFFTREGAGLVREYVRKFDSLVVTPDDDPRIECVKE